MKVEIEVQKSKRFSQASSSPVALDEFGWGGGVSVGGVSYRCRDSEMGESHSIASMSSSMPPSLPSHPFQRGSNPHGGGGHPKIPGDPPYTQQSFPQQLSATQPLSTPQQQRSYYHRPQPQTSCPQVGSPQNVTSNSPYLYPAQTDRPSYFSQSPNLPQSSSILPRLDHHPHIFSGPEDRGNPHAGSQPMPSTDQVSTSQPPAQCPDSNPWSLKQTGIHWLSGGLQRGLLSPSGTRQSQSAGTSTGLSFSSQGLHHANSNGGEFTMDTSIQHPSQEGLRTVGSAGDFGSYPLAVGLATAPKAQDAANSTDPLQVCF